MRDMTMGAVDEACERWYVTSHRRILAALVAYCGDLTEAAEVTDEAFARALGRWDRLPSTWPRWSRD